MASHRINWRAASATLLALAAGSFTPARLAGQRVLDLPVREGGGPDALAAGPVAVFWNPGAVGIPAGRGAAVLLDIRGPSATSLDGLAFAALLRLDERTALGGGVRHVGLDAIPVTSTSPLPDDVEGTLDIGETTLSLAAARSVSPMLVFGAAAHYTRASRALEAEDEVAVGAGFRHAGRDWRPGFGAAARVGEEGTEWEAGVELAPLRARIAGSGLDLSYGLAGSPRYHGVSHRITVGATWSPRVRVSAGLAGEPGSAGHAWDPVAGAVVNLHRYSVGILREELPGGIGSVYTFRLGLSF